MEVSLVLLDVFFLPLYGSPPPPANHPYVITYGTGKSTKMAGNSASKPLNSTPNELPCITVEWWRIAWKKFYAFSRYTSFYNNYFKSSIFVIACIRPFWQIWPQLFYTNGGGLTKMLFSETVFPLCHGDSYNKV